MAEGSWPMLFGRKKTQKTMAKVASVFSQNNKNNNGRATSDKGKQIEENKEDEQDWLDELVMMNEIFDD